MGQLAGSDMNVHEALVRGHLYKMVVGVDKKWDWSMVAYHYKSACFCLSRIPLFFRRATPVDFDGVYTPSLASVFRSGTYRMKLRT